MLVLLGAVFLVGCTTGGGDTTGTGTVQGADTTAGQGQIDIDTAPAAEGDRLVSPAEAVAVHVGPSVVNIRVEGTVAGVFGTEQFSGAGSGVILDDTGHIITNNHVVADENDNPVDTVIVTLTTGEQLQARIIARDPATDLAVLKVENTKVELPHATFITDMAAVKIGQYAIAIGNPLDYANSVTLGIVSGVNRSIDQALTGGGFNPYVDLIQTDAPISPGNSGGALVDAQGRVIGINVAYLPPSSTGATSIGFAIPADVAVDTAQQLIATGRASHPYIGVSTQQVTPRLQQQFNLSRASGILLAQVADGGPAARAQLQQGDIVLSVNGQEMNDPAQLISYLRRQEVGDSITIVYDRNGEEQTVRVTLAERPQALR